jgi:glutathione synthase/RimK-type ligase-like ATP-grasp enzyme
MHTQASLQLLIEAAEDLGLQPKLITDYGLLSIKIGKTRHTIFFTACPLNDSLASYLTKNKHATRLVLAANDLPNIPYLLPKNIAEAEVFLQEHSWVIAKPTKGKQSRGVKLIKSSPELAKHPLKNMLLESYIKGIELRCLVANNKVLAVHQRDFPGQINNPKNVRRIALAKDKWQPQITAIAQAAMRALNLRFGVVDFIIKNDTPYILEINSAPGLYYFQYPHKGKGIAIGRIYLSLIAKHYQPNWKAPF